MGLTSEGITQSAGTISRSQRPWDRSGASQGSRSITRVLPAVPTFEESGVPGFEISTWFGIFTQRLVPQPILATLNETVNRILRLDEVRARLATLDAEPAGGSIEEFAAFIRSERARWGPIVKEANIKGE